MQVGLEFGAVRRHGPLVAAAQPAARTGRGVAASGGAAAERALGAGHHLLGRREMNKLNRILNNLNFFPEMSLNFLKI